MADPKHLKTLKKGVEEWNKWRKENPQIKPDLRDADLRSADLRSADLRDADLRDADLSDADLSDADLSSADLSSADLSFAKLSFAKLRYADLSFADLSDADLSSAKLSDADLSYAKLRDAKLSSAKLNFVTFLHCKFQNTNFKDSEFGYTTTGFVDLDEALFLETVKHGAPSTVGSECFKNLKGIIPVEFLKGTGLTDYEIESIKLHNPNLTPTEVTDIAYKIDELRNEAPIQLHNLFISYSHKDKDFVDAMELLLKAKKIRFWRDIHDATAGPVDKILVRALEQTQTALLILSKDSMDSDWVEFEIQKARELEKDLDRHVICPITLDKDWEKNNNWSGPLLNQVKKYNVLDFSDWRNKSSMASQFEKVIKGLDLFYKK